MKNPLKLNKVIVIKSKTFAIRIVKLSKYLNENKKEYLQPVIEIEYYEEVILCSGTPDSPWGDAGIFPDEPDNGTW